MYIIFTVHALLYHLLLLTRSTNVNIVVIISMAAEKKKQTDTDFYTMYIKRLFFNSNRGRRYRQR